MFKQCPPFKAMWHHNCGRGEAETIKSRVKKGCGLDEVKERKHGKGHKAGREEKWLPSSCAVRWAFDQAQPGASLYAGQQLFNSFSPMTAEGR